MLVRFPAPTRLIRCASLVAVILWLSAAGAVAQPSSGCPIEDLTRLRRNPTPAELKCYFGISGPGRFGLLSYVDVPVYQPATPMPGTHVIGVPGHPRPTFLETYEHWEWRILRTRFGPEVHQVHRSLDLLHPAMAEKIVELERRLTREGIAFVRTETWRSFARQAYLFQQGRSRPGPVTTATLTSWHSLVDRQGQPAGRAVDYNVASSHQKRFHELAAEVGLRSFGHDSHDPGHVFLPNLEDIPPVELAVLRTLPRVPEVTLATGLPVDQQLPPGGRAELRRRLEVFLDGPYLGIPLASLAVPERPVRIADAVEIPERRRWPVVTASAAGTPQPVTANGAESAAR